MMSFSVVGSVVAALLGCADGGWKLLGDGVIGRGCSCGGVVAGFGYGVGPTSVDAGAVLIPKIVEVFRNSGRPNGIRYLWSRRLVEDSALCHQTAIGH